MSTEPLLPDAANPPASDESAHPVEAPPAEPNAATDAPAATEPTAAPAAATADEAPAAVPGAESPAAVPGAESPAAVPTTEAPPADTAPRMDAAACAAALKARFPALFDGAPKPIKLRIQADIQARAPGVFPRQALSAFLHRHTTSTLYLIALSQQPHRLDLDGQPAGEVAAEHRDAAAHEVARRRALRKEREAQMHEARRAALQAEREAARAQARPPARQPAAPGGEDGAAPPRPPRPPRPRPDARPGPRPTQDRRPPRAPRVEPAAAMGQPFRPATPPATQPPSRHPSRPPARPNAPSVAPSDAASAAPTVDAHPAPRDEDPARRDRARLLRDFETSPLTKANFCVLKRIKPEDLDAQLAQARQEAAAWAAAHPRPPRGDRRPDGARPASAPSPHPRKDRNA